MQLANPTHPQVCSDRLLRLPEVEAATGLKKSTVYLLMSRGTFPRCVPLTARSVAWSESQVQQWVQNRIAAAQEVTQ
jgi:prophage regulatory protein